MRYIWLTLTDSDTRLAGGGRRLDVPGGNSDSGERRHRGSTGTRAPRDSGQTFSCTRWGVLRVLYRERRLAGRVGIVVAAVADRGQLDSVKVQIEKVGGRRIRLGRVGRLAAAHRRLELLDAAHPH